MSIDLYAFTDEAGNTGLNIFDAAQPWFWTGTLLSSLNLDALAGEFRKILRSAVSGELHANVLGVGGIEAIAPAIQWFLAKYTCSFIFTRVEKRTVASLKLVDCLLDSGNNQAVSPVHYNNRFLRLSLAGAIVTHVSPAMQEEYGKAYAERDQAGFVRVLGKRRWNISTKLHDERAKR